MSQDDHAQLNQPEAQDVLDDPATESGSKAGVVVKPAQKPSGETMVTAGSYLLERFHQVEWLREMAGRFLKNPADLPDNKGVIEAHLDQVANPAVKTLIAASLFKHLHKTIVLVCPEPQRVIKYRYELSRYLKPEQVEAYPAEEFSPYDLSVIPVKSLLDQHRILSRLQANLDAPDYQRDPFVLLLSPKNLLLRHLSMAMIQAQQIKLSVGDEMSPDSLTKRCLELGYTRASLIMEPGEFSSRGDIFDLFPVNGEPVRIEFFGDTVETMRRIDVENQRSITSVKSVTAIQRAGLVLTPENVQILEEKIPACLKKQQAKLTDVEYDGLETTLSNQIQALEQEFHPDGIDYYAPLIYGNEAYESVLDVLPADALVIFDDWQVLTNNLGGLSDRLNRQLQEGVDKGRLLDINFSYHMNDHQALALLKKQVPRRLFLETLPMNLFGDTDAATTLKNLETFYPLEIQAAEQFKADMPQAMAHIGNLRKQGYQVFITTDHPQRVLDAAKEHDVAATYWSDGGVSSEDASWQGGVGADVLISKIGPQEGFILPGEKLAHFTDGELFGQRMKRLVLDKKSSRRRDDIDVINSIHDLRTGDYVVHQKHGIGQFINLTQIEIDGEKREYLSVMYAGNDKLHVPVDQVNLLSRYRGSGEKPAKLSKMGGIEWNKVKGKVKKSIANIAKDLMTLYARRAKIKGHIFDHDSPWQVEMEEAFPYSETPDQWQAIQDVKGDMESDKPMDRLICGDVGFGKTEVALRAIFKAVLSGKQVAFLAPTTILAQQHFNTLTERFKPYPVRIGLLSRFRSPKEQKDVVNRLAMGEVDVVIGTHRLLQKDVRYKDMGLLVIDEEQRFGVAHKEKLKHMRAEVDVLTLSATPIPRTLYMSLSGVREMSLISTPPTNRLPIQTFVGPYNPAQIRMAILQELDRGGQIYFVHNRVQTIYGVAEHLQDLVPEARFQVAHGQMNGDDLETIMLDFANQQFDVLLCTTIIESGLDIPNVNTIIIDRADRFGLAQLYQIRGRVGRSNIQAYAYCYYDPERMLTQDAKDRLRAIREFTVLGSGYQIALRDLEIRGVGNILGAEQHGHMVAVGFDLYCEMLEDEISELKGELVDKKEQAIIDLNVTAFMPESWVGDQDVKLSEYKRLADIDTELALEIIQAEWRDRFGDIPWETLQLVKLVRLRILATELRMPLVRADEEFIRISTPLNLQEWMFLQNKLPAELGKRARWVPAVTSQQSSLPVLLIKHLGMDGTEMVEFLLEFFTAIKHVQIELPAA